MNKFLSILAAAFAGLSSMSAVSAVNANSESPAQVKVFYYSLSDPFIGHLSISLQDQAIGSMIRVTQYDAQGSLQRQLEQLEFVLNGQSDRTPVMVNPVDNHDGSEALEIARRHNVPVIFFNRRPSDEVMNSYPDAWFVGTNPELAGMIQGQMVSEYVKSHPEMDRNGDGIISYLMFKGESNHEDTEQRTSAFVRNIANAGVKFVQLNAAYCDWSRPRAFTVMNNLISRHGLDGIELVVCNSDSMALGVIDALQDRGYNRTETSDGSESPLIPVFGIDALSAALDAVERGIMAGTVLNNYSATADVLLRIVEGYLYGEQIDSDFLGYPVMNRTVEVPYVKVNTDTVYSLR